MECLLTSPIENNELARRSVNVRTEKDESRSRLERGGLV